MRVPVTSLVSSLALFSFTNVIAAYSCDANTLPTLELFGASILSVTAVQVNNYPLSNPPTSFCNVTITYTHPGQNDTINTLVWLPNEWNGRFQGVGGGGWITGYVPQRVIPAVARGYAAASTDGGHNANATTESWGLVSPGNINWYQLQDFAATSLNDMTVLGKQVTEAYYGKAIKKSYWMGCSQGGRQGLMMAQRYPDAYDGILAAAPAVNWGEFIPAMFWPQRVMNKAGYFPSQCEFNAIIAAGISACDELDGLKDGVVALYGQCAFDPKSVVGQPYSCPDANGTITAQGAAVIEEIWSGPVFSDGKFQWYQITPQSPLGGTGNTVCSANGTCTGVPSIFPFDWHRVFLQQNASFDPYSYTDAEWDAAYRLSVNKFTSVIGTNDPDLTGFKQNNGKMITWHGTYDQLIPVNNTIDYYQRVLEHDSSAADYYRIFTAPGVYHCSGGVGPQPTDPLAQLVDWVENGVAPATLKGNRTVAGENWQQDVCQWPLTSIYKGGDPKSASSFACE